MFLKFIGRFGESENRIYGLTIMGRMFFMGRFVALQFVLKAELIFFIQNDKNRSLNMDCITKQQFPSPVWQDFPDGRKIYLLGWLLIKPHRRFIRIQTFLNLSCDK